MGYAILRHRVIDVHFVLNRTIVFFAVGAAAIAVFAGFDWISANVLPLSRSQVALALAVAFIFGLLMPRYYGSLVALVDSVAFPKRRAATMRMNELRLAIEAHNDGQQTMHVLVRDACKALGLVSAAAFRAVPDGGFIREDSTGWPAGTTWHLLSTDRIVRDMSVPVNRPLRVRDQWPAGTNMPRGSARPILCCPIGNHGRPLALMFYGGHTDGAEIDPDEARALMKLCNLYGRDAFT
jgi:hypothetical protein